MTREEAAAIVLAAVAAGRIPEGSPSHLAALGRERDAEAWAAWAYGQEARLRRLGRERRDAFHWPGDPTPGARP